MAVQPLTDRRASLAQLAASQCGIVTRAQLRRLGWLPYQIHREIVVGRWSRLTDSVVALQTGPLDLRQRLWLGVLHAGPKAVLSHRTACQLVGLTGWETEVVEVMVPKSDTVGRLPGFFFHETRRDYAPWVHPVRRPPTLMLEPAALLAAERQRLARTGIGLLAACVQQRLTKADRLLTTSMTVRKLRHGHDFRLALCDIAGGAQSFAELELGAKCQLWGIAPPTRQSVRFDASGRKRYLDAEWQLADGTALVLEVDGSFHLRTEHWWRDMRRERRLVVGGRTVLRCSTIELRHDFQEIAVDLIAMGVPRLGSLVA